MSELRRYGVLFARSECEKDSHKAKASGTWEGGVKLKGDVGFGPLGGGAEIGVGQVNSACDHSKFVKMGVNGTVFFYNPALEKKYTTDEDGDSNWHSEGTEPNWQESVPTDKNTWYGNWIPKGKERFEDSVFFGFDFTHTF